MIHFNCSVFTLATLALAVSLTATRAAQAKDKPPADIPGDVFFTIKGQQPFALERLHPGIVAALMLTDQQKTALQEALDQTIRNPELRTAGQALKNNPSATDADRAKAQQATQDARAKLKEAVEKTLTADQKALVAKIQAAFDESQKAASTALQAEFGQAKGNAEQTAKLRERMQDELREQLTERLAKILDPEQKAAVQAAALVHLEREQAATKTKKQK
jgi:hypothetical protein